MKQVFLNEIFGFGKKKMNVVEAHKAMYAHHIMEAKRAYDQSLEHSGMAHQLKDTAEKVPGGRSAAAHAHHMNIARAAQALGDAHHDAALHHEREAQSNG